jgi:hypothetical protein
MGMEIKDMPKLQSPFIREGQPYVVKPEITEGYNWVFEDESVIATEKLDGTNVSIVVENGQVTRVFNRKQWIPFINKGSRHIIEGLLESYDRGYVKFSDGQYFGELIGPKVQGNPYGLEYHIWIPFNSYARKKLAYKSWGKYPKTFEALSDWFKDGLNSLFMMQRGVLNQPAEGIVFHNPNTGEMAKLRRDMFDWYNEKRHKK